MRTWIGRAVTVLLAGGAGIALVAGPSLAAASTVGSAGGGDPYFPWQGNGGYDVGHYDLTLGYTPATRALTAVAILQATTTQALSRFDLDLRRTLTVSSVSVDGHPAAFAQPAQQEQELVITPPRQLAAGAHFTVVVRYAGTPQAITDPDGSLEGWVPTADGAFVVDEPQGSPSWFPCNDSPTDKATFDFHVTVPQGVQAIANGELVGSSSSGGTTHVDWRQPRPMSTYLAFVSTGAFEVSSGTSPGGIPWIDAVDPRQAAQSQTQLAKLPAMLDFYATVYGPYPWTSAGALVDDAPEVGYALETASRPSFDSAPDELTLAHELAHQWVGDDVTLRQWRDIWVNEGFAEWSSWYWSEHTGQTSAQQFFDRLYATDATDSDFWNPPPGNPGDASGLFAGSIYDRGAMTLQALRTAIGDDAAFLRLMRSWVAAHAYGNATVADFVTFTEHRFPTLTGLPHLFDVWLYQPGKPASW